MRACKVLGSAALLTLTMVSVAMAQGIANSKHNFANGGTGTGVWKGSSDQICIYCHAPHNNLNLAGELLWNHTTSSVTSYSMYTSPTQNSIAGTPDATSKLCLSCHDGTVALDAYGGAAGNAANRMNQLSTNADIAGTAGNDLSDSHPISIDYTASHVDVVATTPGLKDPTSTLSGLTGGGFITGDLLYNNKVECSSCHDVHNKYNVGTYLLKKSNTGSQLCLTCHIK